jgi:hypothetical protein
MVMKLYFWWIEQAAQPEFTGVKGKSNIKRIQFIKCFSNTLNKGAKQ